MDPSQIKSNNHSYIVIVIALDLSSFLFHSDLSLLFRALFWYTFLFHSETSRDLSLSLFVPWDISSSPSDYSGVKIATRSSR